MLPDDVDAVTASYHRCMHGGEFVDTFYDLFLAKSPEVADKFRHTDFVHQKLMLRESLLMMLMYNHKQADVQHDMERLATRHSRNGVDIPPHLYDLWLDALCEAVARHDAEFTSEVTELWRTAMKPGIDLIISKY
jgi:hemoglobin-like flavoprotein